MSIELQGMVNFYGFYVFLNLNIFENRLRQKNPKEDGTKSRGHSRPAAG